MSYRNDHDATLARVDALTHQLDQTEAERDDLQAEVKRLRDLPPRPRLRTNGRALLVMTLIGGVCAAVLPHHHHSSSPHAPTAEAAVEAARPVPSLPTAVPPRSTAVPPRSTVVPPRPVALPPRSPSADDRAADAARKTTVVTCADRLQRATADMAPRTDLRPLRARCRTELALLVSRRAVPGATSELLARWLALEDQLSPSLAAYNTYILRDPEGTHYRAPAALRDAFHAALRARDAILPEVHAALNAVEMEPSPGALAHATAEPPALTAGK
jgi:hypothetical protein